MRCFAVSTLEPLGIVVRLRYLLNKAIPLKKALVA